MGSAFAQLPGVSLCLPHSRVVSQSCERVGMRFAQTLTKTLFGSPSGPFSTNGYFAIRSVCLSSSETLFLVLANKGHKYYFILLCFANHVGAFRQARPLSMCVERFPSSKATFLSIRCLLYRSGATALRRIWMDNVATLIIKGNRAYPLSLWRNIVLYVLYDFATCLKVEMRPCRMLIFTARRHSLLC